VKETSGASQKLEKPLRCAEGLFVIREVLSLRLEVVQRRCHSTGDGCFRQWRTHDQDAVPECTEEDFHRQIHIIRAAGLTACGGIGEDLLQRSAEGIVEIFAEHDAGMLVVSGGEQHTAQQADAGAGACHVGERVDEAA